MNISRVTETAPDVQAEDERDYRASLIRSAVPAHHHDGIVAYLVHHEPPGSYLISVLENDLMGAVRRGDEQALTGLVALTRWLVDYAPILPIPSWGSEAAVENWIAQRRGRES